MKEKLTRARTWLKNYIDLNDIFVFGGIALAGYGIAQIHPPTAYLVVGVTFVWLGKFR